MYPIPLEKLFSGSAHGPVGGRCSGPSSMQPWVRYDCFLNVNVEYLCVSCADYRVVVVDTLYMWIFFQPAFWMYAFYFIQKCFSVNIHKIFFIKFWQIYKVWRGWFSVLLLVILICVGKINEIVARVEEINIDIAKVIFSCRLLVFWSIPKI